MYLKQKKKKKKKKPSKSLEYEDVLYFDLQSHPMACTLGSVVMGWKQTLQGSDECFLMTDWCDIDIISHEKF